MTAIDTTTRDDVARLMARHVAKFATPISVPNPDGVSGRHWGTGNYLDLLGKTVLLTNEHVIRRRRTVDLTHMFHGLDDVYQIVGHHAEQPWPLDVAAVELDGAAWTARPHHRAAPVPADRLALAHTPHDGEFLFVHGFAGANSLFLGNTLKTDASNILCHEGRFPHDPKVDGRFHFAMDYRADLAETIDGLRGLPDPHGMSGSLVWNTCFKETAAAGGDWTPDRAYVTGLLWYFTDDKLVATRIEHVRSCLLQFAEIRRARRLAALAAATGAEV